MIARRNLLALLSVAVVPPAWAADGNFVIDWQGGPQTPNVAKSLHDQIALVERLPVSPDAMAFFRSQVITVDLAEGTATRAGPRGIFFERRPMPADNPVLLHEIIHRWQLLRMSGGRANADVQRFYETAKSSERWPANAYMLTNSFEFFAMMASVVLHGRAARPPFVRDNVKAKAPDLYAFIVKEFGLRGA